MSERKIPILLHIESHGILLNNDLSFRLAFVPFHTIHSQLIQMLLILQSHLRKTTLSYNKHWFFFYKKAVFNETLLRYLTY